MLAAAGADVNAPVPQPGPNASEETALHWAASSDDVAVLDALLDSGANIEAPGAVFTGGTPMSDAVVFAQWRAARRLLERGATTTIWQATALGLSDQVRDLCSMEPAPNSKDITNAFWHACRGGQQPTAGLLLDRGADVNWIGHDGKTPCDTAQDAGAETLVRWLRERGAKSAAEPKWASGASVEKRRPTRARSRRRLVMPGRRR
jgi:ankyrin repeat protein